MERSSFFTSLNGDRKYKTSDLADFFRTFIGNGVFPNPSTNLQVIANNDMTVTVRPGPAWVNGYMYKNTEDLPLTVDYADSTLKRIDLVVIRLDFVERRMFSQIRRGELSSHPIAPTLQRDNDAYEIGIARIAVEPATMTITQSQITDTRLDSSVCGIVTQLVNEIDTATLYNQLKAYIEEKELDMAIWIQETKKYFSTWLEGTKTEYTNNFNSWFDNIKGILDEDVAGNLLNKILELENKVGTGVVDIIVTEDKDIPRKDKTFYFIVTDEQTGSSTSGGDIRVSPNMGIKII